MERDIKKSRYGIVWQIVILVCIAYWKEVLLLPLVCLRLVTTRNNIRRLGCAAWMDRADIKNSFPGRGLLGGRPNMQPRMGRGRVIGCSQVSRSQHSPSPSAGPSKTGRTSPQPAYLDPHTFRRDYMARLANLTVSW